MDKSFADTGTQKGKVKRGLSFADTDKFWKLLPRVMKNFLADDDEEHVSMELLIWAAHKAVPFYKPLLRKEKEFGKEALAQNEELANKLAKTKLAKKKLAKLAKKKALQSLANDYIEELANKSSLKGWHSLAHKQELEQFALKKVAMKKVAMTKMAMKKLAMKKVAMRKVAMKKMAMTKLAMKKLAKKA